MGWEDPLEEEMASQSESACSAGDPGSILDQEDPLKKGEATYSSILAWGIHRELDMTFTLTFPVFLLGESHGQRAWQTTAYGVAKSQKQLGI